MYLALGCVITKQTVRTSEWYVVMAHLIMENDFVLSNLTCEFLTKRKKIGILLNFQTFSHLNLLRAVSDI